MRRGGSGRPLLALVAVLALASCGGDPPRRDPPPQERPRPAEVAPVASPQERVELRVGNRRALIYTWRGRFPKELQGADVLWILSQDEYVKTEDFANTWKVVYCTKDGSKVLQIAACEYVSPKAASESYDSFASKVEKPAPLAAPEGCEKATAAALGDHALAAALSSRYLFIFDRPGGPEVGEGVVKTFVKACFTEPKSGE
jgi:hypothetical protein